MADCSLTLLSGRRPGPPYVSAVQAKRAPLGKGLSKLASTTLPSLS